MRSRVPGVGKETPALRETATRCLCPSLPAGRGHRHQSGPRRTSGRGRDLGMKGSLRTETTGCPVTVSLPFRGVKPSPRVTGDQARWAVTREGTPWKGSGKGQGTGEGGWGQLQGRESPQGCGQRTPGRWPAPPGTRAALRGLSGEGEPGTTREVASGQELDSASSLQISLPSLWDVRLLGRAAGLLGGNRAVLEFTS